MKARIVREAEERDGPLLTDLRRRSKAYWGYSQEWVRRVEGDVVVPCGAARGNKLMFVLLEGEQMLGFYSLIRWDRDVMELDDFFLDVPYIGKGLGQELWKDLVARSRTLGHTVLHIISDPHSEGFYRKQGACRVGEVISKSDPERILPKLRYRLE